MFSFDINDIYVFSDEIEILKMVWVHSKIRLVVTLAIALL